MKLLDMQSQIALLLELQRRQTEALERIAEVVERWEQ